MTRDDPTDMLRILVDMNLSPDWIPPLRQAGWVAVHWSALGDPRSSDPVLMDWARVNRHVVFTNDLDFGTLLALTHAAGPSVVQIRSQDLLPDRIGSLVVSAIRQHEADLTDGALVVIDESRSRVRILPLS